jgi:Ran GTPase-activating protein (RanGAP) involved in mRNA processing and transport
MFPLADHKKQATLKSGTARPETMSSKKRKGDLPVHATAEAVQKSLRSSKLSQPELDMDDDEGGKSDHAATRKLLAQRDAELAAALVKVERLEAAASEPCARCNFYSDWTVRVRTMSGQVYTIACPDGPKTLVAQVKQKLAKFDPKCHILLQIALVLPCEASSSSSSSNSSNSKDKSKSKDKNKSSSSSSNNNSADPTESTLADDRTLASYGVSKRDALDLFLVDMNWSHECRELIELIRDGGEEVNFETVIDDDSALAVSWALVNAVCFLFAAALRIFADIDHLNFRVEMPGHLIDGDFLPYLCLAQINPTMTALEFADESVSASVVSNMCAALCALSTAECLHVGSRISRLAFSRNDIGDAGANSCCELIRVSEWLTELFLFECGISSAGAASLSSALSASAFQHLEILSLGRNAIGSDGAKSIGAALSVSTSLKRLYMGGCQIGNGGVEALAEALKIDGSLQELYIENNEFDSIGVAFLADALKVNSSLRDLDLGGNRVGDADAVLLSAALRLNSGLEHLDLAANTIGDRGATSLGGALRANVSLQRLNLSSNNIGDLGAIALGIALAFNSSLTWIELSFNEFGDGGAVALCEALCGNSAMKKISMYGNKIGASGAESIGKAQRENSHLEIISLDPVELEEN